VQSLSPPINTPPLRALYDNLDGALGSGSGESGPPMGPIQATWRAEAGARHRSRHPPNVKKADWRGNRFKEREVRNAIKAVLGGTTRWSTIFEIVKAQREY
jgi:type I restriction enzyme, R subunit